MRVIGIVVGLLLAAGPGFSQTFQIDFRRAMQAQDTAKARKVLAAWQQKEPNSPDRYVAQFNYLLSRAQRLELRGGAGAGDGFVIKDKKGKTAGLLTSGYDPALLKKAQDALQQGIVLAPERLDMRFGMAKAYEEAGQPAAQVTVLRDALADRARLGKSWRWRDNAELPAPEQEFLPACLEEYASVYWQKEGAEALETGKQLSELIVQYYPESSLGPFNLGVYYGLKEQPQQAYTYLQQADKLQPNDASTVANLTRTAIMLKKKAEAQQYLARLRRMPGTEEAVRQAAKQIQQLK